MVTLIVIYSLGFVTFLYVCLNYKLKQEGYINLRHLLGGLFLSLLSWVGVLIWVFETHISLDKIIYRDKAKQK